MKKIPKIIHYCWFGNSIMPQQMINNIISWKKECPNYKIIKWSESNFNVYNHKFTYLAYKQHNWAFVSDYVRLYALKNFGGIYLDTDVKMIKSYDNLLFNNSFIGLESWSSINSGLSYGTKPNDKNVKDLLQIYDKIGNSSKTLSNFSDNTVKILTDYFKKKGFKYKNKKQMINGCTIYPTEYFCPQSRITGNMHITNNTYSIHQYYNSWTNYSITSKRQIHILLGDIMKRIIRPKLYNYLYNLYLNISLKIKG